MRAHDSDHGYESDLRPKASRLEEPESAVAMRAALSGAPWARDLEGIDAIDPDLTLKGLAILHDEVAGGERLELGLP